MTGPRRITKEEREALAEKQTQQRREVVAQRKRDAAVTFSHAGEAGIRWLRWLLNETGYDRSPVTADPTTYELQQLNLVHNAALQTIWRKVREDLPRDLVIAVEFGQEDTPDE